VVVTEVNRPKKRLGEKRGAWVEETVYTKGKKKKKRGGGVTFGQTLRKRMPPAIPRGMCRLSE